MMRFRAGSWSLLVLAGTAFAPLPAVAQAPPLASLARAEQDQPNEQRWLVASTLEAGLMLARGVLHAQEAPPVIRVRGQATPPAWLPVRYPVTVGQRALTATVDISTFVWDPAAYEPVLGEVLGPAAASPDREYQPASILRDLTEPRTETLQAVDDRVSAGLAAHPTSPAAHEQAALLLAAFALREFAGPFTDPRPAMCRLAAQLAIARVLRGKDDETADGDVARAALLALAGRQADAKAALDHLDRAHGQPGLAPWIRALGLRVTEDWREPVPADATLVERLEYARAVGSRAGANRLLDALDVVEREAIPDWGRLAAGWWPTVEAGGRYVHDAMVLELDDTLASWQRFHPDTEPTPEGIVSDLNEDSGVADRGLPVLDWTLWAGYHHRNLCDLALLTSRHLGNAGRPEDRSQWHASADHALTALHLYPLVQALRAETPAAFEVTIPSVRALMADRPELVTAANWKRVAEGESGRRARLSQRRTWFAPAMPHGTVFDVWSRGWGPDGHWAMRREDVPRLLAVAPYSYPIAWEDLCQRFGDPVPRMSTPALRRAFANYIDYDVDALGAMLRVLNGNPDEYVPVARRQCEIDADRCYGLARYLFDLGREPEAAAAYDDYAERARDRVAVSNRVGWLIHYDHDTGRLDRALELATMAADVYSSRGLESLGDELDRRGRFDEAEQAYQAIVERYDETGPLLSFYLRQDARAGLRAPGPKAMALMPRTFGSGGLLRMDPKVPTGPPGTGVRITQVGLTGRQAGLVEGDIVIGMDGWRIGNSDQYAVILRMRDTDAMKFYVYRGGKYLLINAVVPRRAYAAWIEDCCSVKGTGSH